MDQKGKFRTRLWTLFELVWIAFIFKFRTRLWTDIWCHCSSTSVQNYGCALMAKNGHSKAINAYNSAVLTYTIMGFISKVRICNSYMKLRFGAGWAI
ncbi:MAG TPA: hypothetical protein DIS90_06730 [Cytophagales bacterium]|nr:hypothetical protein [Cytophagales bacterium]